MVVEEALSELVSQYELGAQPQMDMVDMERGKKALPRRPSVREHEKPLPQLPDAVHKWS